MITMIMMVMTMVTGGGDNISGGDKDGRDNIGGRSKTNAM